MPQIWEKESLSRLAREAYDPFKEVGCSSKENLASVIRRAILVGQLSAIEAMSTKDEFGKYEIRQAMKREFPR